LIINNWISSKVELTKYADIKSVGPEGT